MPNVIYHDFNEYESDNRSNLGCCNWRSRAKIFTHIGKSGEKFVCMKFNPVLKVQNKSEKNSSQVNHKSSFELFQEIMEKIYEK